MPLGLFGGTFDPVHLGHLIMAEQCLEACQFDELWFIPAGDPPHKSGGAVTPGAARAEMLELAIAGHPRFRVSRVELQRPGPSFTVDTLQQIHEEVPARELFFLIGADSLADLPLWRNPQRIAELATLVVVNRGSAPAVISDRLRAEPGDTALARIRQVSIPGIDISSSDLRRRVRAGRSIRYLTPRAVECYIATHGLYRE